MQLKKKEPLKKHSTFRIGGPARYFFAPKDIKEARQALKFAKTKKLPVLFLGNASNILFSDKGFKGVVIHYSEEKIEIKGSRVTVSAGINISRLLQRLSDQGLSGLEFLAGIPGWVGGTVAMNGGTGKNAIGSRILRVRVLTRSGREQILKKIDLKLGYRESVLQKGRLLLIEAEFALKRGKPDRIKKKIRELILKKQKSQPLRFPSAGSVFKNPKGKPAGYLIEAAGCKGLSVGDAKVSSKHANFIINQGRASSKDVQKLMELIKKKVFNKFKIRLDPEIILVDDK